MRLILVAAGSSYYHWNPNNQTLVWDRLPMTICFMSLFVALLGGCPRIEAVARESLFESVFSNI
ncbi:MAG: hypothetical protein HOE45_04700 [Gammaproteobacteria bacterium]|jgi:hypothetical protein|nr:hypothetical protein [Gammaproteobacteria bacterium]MBT4146167.1 hypothetical protein [Gammaproteobacteria bacterium]MBT5223070.1 hypothetical protein [Gammaproteobacteria bacterium]MBT5967384.1 hypothetical protein [Gammaproteobacteria bacterium]MBT6575022.1 hypothetical protein [Gammaproteobacteria bacterium]